MGTPASNKKTEVNQCGRVKVESANRRKEKGTGEFISTVVRFIFCSRKRG